MKDLILIEGNEKYQFDNLEELVKSLIDENYYELSDKEQKEKLKLKALANCMIDKIDIAEEKDNIDEEKFVAIDEITYIYSLLIFNKIMILESTSAEILTKGMDKTGITDNYIIVNTFAKKLLNEYLSK